MSNDSEQDPMLGDEATQKAYVSNVLDQVYKEADARRQARRAEASATSESPPVILGATGFGGGINAV